MRIDREEDTEECMGKIELKKSFIVIDGEDELEKDNYLKELGNSVHNYVRTGVKNKQLDELVSLEEKFQKRYRERFDINIITDMIMDGNEKLVLEIEQKELQNIQASEKKNYKQLVQKTSRQLTEMVNHVLAENLNRVLKDAAYLSHINMLYDIYEKEEKLRREEKEYEKISEQFRYMADITKELSKCRRMELSELQSKANLTKKEMEDVVNACSKYFNIRDKKDDLEISLSPSGRKYCNYIINTKQTYSQEAFNQLTYKNMTELMQSLEKSYDWGVAYEVHIEGISPERERALLCKYNSIVKKLTSDNQDVYDVKVFINDNKKERANINERSLFKIPDEW